MEYTIDDIIEDRILVSCDTQEEAVQLLQFLKGKGLRWRSGETLDNIQWGRVFSPMCYGVERVDGRVCVVSGPKQLIDIYAHNYKVIKYSTLNLLVDTQGGDIKRDREVRA